MTGNLELTYSEWVNWNERIVTVPMQKRLRLHVNPNVNPNRWNHGQIIELCISNIVYALEMGGASKKRVLCMVVKLSTSLNNLKL